MSEKSNELKTNPLDTVQLSLVCLIEGEARELLNQGRNPEAKRIAEACDKLLRWSESTRGQLTAGQRERLANLTFDQFIAAVG